MDHKKQWLMDQQTFDKFTTYRRKLYSSNINAACDNNITKYYLHIGINFFRKRQLLRDDTFALEKLVFTSVSLFKRYYLVNQYRDEEEPTQHLICCFYLALKLHEVPEQEIKSYAEGWKKRKQPKSLFKKNSLHYGDEGYSEKQLLFLSNIGFQIGRSPLIQPLESLYHQIIERMGEINEQKKLRILRIIFHFLNKVFYDEKLLFLYPGPKLAMCIAILWVEKVIQGEDEQVEYTVYFNQEIKDVIKNNKQQIEEIKEKIRNTQQFKVNQHQSQLTEFINLLKKRRNRSFSNPGRKSPRLSPKSFTDFNDKDL